MVFSVSLSAPEIGVALEWIWLTRSIFLIFYNPEKVLESNIYLYEKLSPFSRYDKLGCV